MEMSAKGHQHKTVDQVIIYQLVAATMYLGHWINRNAAIMNARIWAKRRNIRTPKDPYAMWEIAKEEPFAAVVEEEYITGTCSNCFKVKLENSLRCTRCSVLHYCSEECRNGDMAAHSIECRLLKRNNGVLWWCCRMVARIIANGGMDQFDHINYDREQMKTDGKFLLSLHRCVAVLLDYLGAEPPTIAQLFSILCKVSAKSLRIGNKNKVGMGFYRELSVLDHSCEPDAYVVFDGKNAFLRTSSVIEFSTSVTISYVHPLNPDRRKVLETEYHVNCKCDICNTPQRGFLEKSARSTCCVQSFCLLDPDATELQCSKCGNVSHIPVRAAITANEESKLVCLRIQGDLDSESATELMETYDKFSKILSPFNLTLIYIAERAFALAQRTENFAITEKFLNHLIPAYEHYMHRGDPYYSIALAGFVKVGERAHLSVTRSIELLTKALRAHNLTFGRTNRNAYLDSLVPPAVLFHFQ